jgi:hypothetical protein
VSVTNRQHQTARLSRERVPAASWRFLTALLGFLALAPTTEAGSPAAHFPIGVWLQNPTNANRYRAAGINTYVGLWQGPTDAQLDELKQAAMFVICAQNELALKRGDSNIIAWMHNDEPDNAQKLGARLGFGSPVLPSAVVSDYQRMKAADATRPVLLNLGQGAAWDGWYGRGRRNNHPEDYPEYLKGCDIASFDIYPVNHRSREVAGNLWFVARGVERLRQWTDDQKPVWACIECTRIDNLERKPTPPEVRAEAWMALVHGARGLIYFVHQFKPKFSEAALLEDSKMLAAITALNQQITELAPVLNSPTVTNAISVTNNDPALPVATMTKQFDGQTYLFAVAMRGQPTSVKFVARELADFTRVKVLGENRTLTSTNGIFTDEFGPWGVHLYRLESARNP